MSTVQHFNCCICGQESLTEADLQTHMLLDHEESAGSCPMCDLRHLTLEELNVHVNTAHSAVLSPGKTGQDHSRSFTGMKAPGPLNHCRISYGQELLENELMIRGCNLDVSKEGCANSEGEQQYESSFTNAVGAGQAVDRSEKIGGTGSESAKTSPDYSTRNKGIRKKSRPCACSFNAGRPGSGHPDNSETLQSNNKYSINGFAHPSCSDPSGKPDSVGDIKAPGQGQTSVLVERKRTRSKAQLNSPSASNSAVVVSCPADDSSDRLSLSSLTATASPLKKILRLFSPSKGNTCELAGKKVIQDTGEEKGRREADLSMNPGQDGNTSVPECPFCDATGLDSEAMLRHVEREHSDALASPHSTTKAAGDKNQWNTSMIQKAADLKPTLLSLSRQAHNLEMAITCPICGLGSYDPDFLTVHINTEHKLLDEEDRAAAVLTVPSSVPQDEAGPSTSANSHSERSVCPVCGMSGLNPKLLNDHVENHFEVGGQDSFSGDRQLARQLAEQERQLQERWQRETFKQLQAKYGMDEVGSYKQQSEKDLETAVVRGQITVTDYNQRKTSLQRSLAVGVDDGKSRTSGLVQKMVTYYTEKTIPGLSYAKLCCDADHYSSSYGDKGWGCGYRNLQMLLSSLVHIDDYRQVLFSGRNAIPSISKLQQLIESAWAKGFDLQGQEQLGGCLVNSRKWIGATEIAAVLSSLRAKCRLVDFHRPTGAGGTHPAMFEWVRDYFGKPRSSSLKLRVLGGHGPRGETIQTRKTPLYLQHEGHSRTVVGCEVHKDGSIRLLLFDPSYQVSDMQGLGLAKLDEYAMRPVRKSLAQMKSKQYQIVSVDRLMTSDQEYEQSKILQSERKP
ncbi:zinc finger with UFM1-specific peptidase domain protein-like [Acanthaster planci]|uniref:Zinc finger-containing ubiquitin peptidase 1 n=1 Tax=Acanthaster planci TaxID=133434 RepID=A0A8B7ZRW4_ACAPL|nr:zinc finger with UFM1-specific peptidase domain protein-like [Acanthaster planci]